MSGNTTKVEAPFYLSALPKLKPLVPLISIFLIFLIGSRGLAAVPVIDFNKETNRLTLDVKQTPLIRILEAIASEGVTLRVDPSINPPVSAAFNNRDIDSALGTLLREYSYSLVWGSNRASGAASPRLEEIQIFRKGERGKLQYLKIKRNLAITNDTDGTSFVTDILLLQVDPSVDKNTLSRLLESYQAEIIDTYLPLGILKLRLPPGTDPRSVAAELTGIQGIRTAEPDYAYAHEGSVEITGNSSTTAASINTSGTAGTAPVVAVMDTGLESDYQTAPFIVGSYDAIAPESRIDDALGHGTQMALLAAGAVNPLGGIEETGETNPVVAIRAFDNNGFTSNYTLIRGIDYALSQGARVLSLSWGTEQSTGLLESAVSYAVDRGMIIVAAAGNEPTGEPVYPAAYERVIGVGALDSSGKKWSNSNYGDFVSVEAPGVAELPVGYEGGPGTYAGTSIATAYTARRIAQILAEKAETDRTDILQLIDVD